MAENTCMEKGGEMGQTPQKSGHLPWEKQSSLEALTPSNPGHQQSQQMVLSKDDQLGDPNLDIWITVLLTTNILGLHTFGTACNCPDVFQAFKRFKQCFLKSQWCQFIFSTTTGKSLIDDVRSILKTISINTEIPWNKNFITGYSSSRVSVLDSISAQWSPSKNTIIIGYLCTASWSGSPSDPSSSTGATAGIGC